MGLCKECGAWLDKKARFCTTCGHRQEQAASAPVSPGSRWLKLPVVAAALLLITAVVAVILLVVAGGGTWEKTFGGDGNQAGYCIIETDGGDYVVAGWTDSFGAGEKDVYLIKINRKGRLVWENSYGGPGDDVAYCVKETADGSFIIAGWSESFGDDRDIYLLKVNHAGDLEWENNFGGDGNNAASALLLTPEGGFIVAGWTELPGHIEKQACAMAFDESGNLLWGRTFGEGAVSFFNSIDHGYNGGMIMAGGIEDGDGIDAYVVKTNSNGAVEWEMVIGRSSHDMINSIRRTSDGGFIMAGESISPVTGTLDIFMVKLDIFDNIEWELYLGVDGNSWGNAVLDAGDGTYLVVGEGAYHGTLAVDAYVAGVDYTGQREWELTLGEEGYTGGYSILQASDGSYVIAGGSSSGGTMNLYMAKIRP